MTEPAGTDHVYPDAPDTKATLNATSDPGHVTNVPVIGPGTAGAVLIVIA